MNHKTAAGTKASAATPRVSSPSEDAPGIKELVAAWWWGEQNEEIAWCIGMADLVAPDPVAKHLYLFHCAEDIGGVHAVRALADWCAGMAAESAVTVNSRKRSMVSSYKPRWGRQAGRDGACLAMWGDDIRDLMPGVMKRGEQYGCHHSSYLRVRDYVQDEARSLLDGFARDMEMAVSGKFDRDFRERWERATGKAWPR